MSQQKVFFALVVVAGCVALAAGQNVDMNACISGAQQQISKYADSMESSLSKFTSAMSQSGQSAVNVQKLTEQTTQIMKEIRGLADPSGFNFEKTMSSWTQIVRLETSMATSFFNPQLGLGMAREYMSLLSSMMNANSEFALSMTSSCVPQLRNTFRASGAN